jgi:hypothetical protein
LTIRAWTPGRKTCRIFIDLWIGTLEGTSWIFSNNSLEMNGGRKMLKKSYSKTGRFCRVTFELPQEIEAESASLCGEFNEWDPAKNPMTRRKNGRFSTTVSLKTGRAYRFKYMLDGVYWENDWSADGYVPNDFASEDSLVDL